MALLRGRVYAMQRLKSQGLASQGLASAMFASVVAMNAVSATCRAAQTDGPPEAAPVILDGNDVVVVEGRARRGGALADIQPELSLTEADIAAYGVTTLGELLAIIEAETSSGRGRRNEPPIVLINGRRVSGFRELDNYPVETIARVDVLPEEVSLQYGFSANQRVINFVLKKNVKITPVNTRTQGPIRGGSVSNRVSVSRVTINDEKRNSIEGFYDSAQALFESERDIIAVNGRPEEQPFRSLTPQADAWRLGFSRSTALPNDAVATFSGSFEANNRERLNGLSLSRQGVPLRQSILSSDGYAGISINSRLAPNTWSITASLDYDRIENDIDFDNIPLGGIGIRAPFSVNWVGNADLLVNQRLFGTSAGFATVAGQIGIETEHQKSGEAAFSDIAQPPIDRRSRQTYSAQASVNFPLLLPTPALGDITLNANAEVNELSDFGLLTTFGYGFTWRPGERWRVIASATHEDGAPTLNEIAAPLVASPAAQVFDFTRQESVLATVITGGNAALTDDSRNVFKLGVQWKPWGNREITLNLDYTKSTIKGETRQFILLTEEFESAFPERVMRDAAGDLLAFDRRPVQTTDIRRQQLRTGITWSKRLNAKRANPKIAGEKRPKKRLTRRRSGRPGAIRASVYHRWTLQDQVTIRDGIAPFDFLNGAATGAFGGASRHIVDATVYRWNNGWGLYVGGKFRSATETIGEGGVLRFSDIFSLVASVSYEFNFSDRILDRIPFLEETRLSVGFSNIFDDVIDVRDETGQTPLTFQPDLIDPIRAGWRVELRKRF